MSEVVAPPQTRLRGTVAWVNPRSRPDWTHCKVKEHGTGRVVPVVAKFSLKLGHPVRLVGQWKEHPKYGGQFAAAGPEPGALSGDEVAFWMERTVDGVGRRRAQAALAAFGDGLAAALVERPDDVAKALELDPGELDKASAALRASSIDRYAVGELHKLGVPLGLATRVIDRVGGERLQVILDDPYYILGRVSRVGWDRVDDVARLLGVKGDDPRRLRAAIDHTCARLSEGQGHTAYPEALLVEELVKFLKLPEPTCLTAVRADAQLGQFEPGLYTHARWADHEREIEAALADNPRLLAGPDVESLARRFASLPEGHKLEGKQLDAFRAAMYSRVVLITGGAGSGKTTLIQTIANAFHTGLGVEPHLVAPTGKAAQRVGQVCGRPAGTIHRFLGLTPASFDQRRREPEDIPAHLARAVIVDESSMADSYLAARLLKTVHADCRVVLVGDPNQLPSVGPGAVLRDLILSRKVPHVHLDVVHRQAGKLLHHCHSILAGGGPHLFESPPPGERPKAPWVFHQLADPDLTRQSLADLFAGGCLDKLGVTPHELMLITPTNRGRLGVDSLNRLVQAAYQASQGRQVGYGDEGDDRYFVGDRVVWRKNNYDLRLMNGEMGVVVESHPDWCLVRFETRGEVEVRNDLWEDLSLAWAITVHRMQGSQARKVVVLCAPEHVDNWGLQNILNRSCFYTACTRSREATVVLGDRDAVRDVLRREQREQRVTTLFRGEGR